MKRLLLAGKATYTFTVPMHIFACGRWWVIRRRP